MDNLARGHNRTNVYLSGDILDNSGCLNVAVSPDQVRVDYKAMAAPHEAALPQSDKRTGPGSL